MGEAQARLSVPRVRRGWWGSIVLAGWTAALLVAVLPASGDTPETGSDPNVTLTVTPSDALSDGQVVTVTGAGFPANTAGTIRQCGGSATPPTCDLTVNVAFVTTAAGDIPPTSVSVERIIDTGTTTFNCGVQACALVATAGGRTSQHHVRMAGAGTSVPTSATSTSTSTSSSTSTSTPPSTSTSTTRPPDPSSEKDRCKDDGWQSLGFKNQGQCVSSVATGRRG